MKYPAHPLWTLATAAGSATRSRLLCPYPQVARYQGGDRESAASFACAPAAR